MRIIIETIPHAAQRYETSGDWQFEPPKHVMESPGSEHWTRPVEETLLVRVSAMGNWRYEALVGLHEACEAVLCRQAGISEEAVTAFDTAFEAARNEHPNVMAFVFRGKMYDEDAEPGDCSDAPYYRQHQIATGVERILAAELGVDWNAYEGANLALYEKGTT